MRSSSLGRALDMVARMHATGLGGASCPWGTTDAADLDAEAAQAVSELARGLSAIGVLLAVHDEDKGVPADELQGLGWLLSGMGDLIDHLNEVRLTPAVDADAAVHEVGAPEADVGLMASSLSDEVAQAAS
ncbi:MAG: hypothetical protein QM639_06435 [Rhodocyclaceae bacterium]